MGIDESSRVHYLTPVGNLEQGLRLIEDDKDVVSMCNGNDNIFLVAIALGYRSMKTARGLITRNEEAQYGLLRDYVEMIRRTDVGSKVILQTEIENENTKPKFKKMYIKYNAQKIGFLGGCKPFVGMDGCHLKGGFGGQLLFPTTKDGNDNIFSVAMVVVEQEKKDSWI